MTGYYSKNQGNRPKQTEYTGPTKAQILRSSKQGWLNVVTPYKKKFVEELKTWIQPSHRMWNPNARLWEVQEMHLEKLITLLEKHFDEVEHDLFAEEQVPSNMFKPVLEALKGLSNGNLDKIYRQLAVAVHPDHGGSNELMTKLNRAYEEIKK